MFAMPTFNTTMAFGSIGSLPDLVGTSEELFACLIVVQGARPGQRFLLDLPSMSLGRASMADLIMDDPGVSRRHAVLKVEGDTVHWVDGGSTNGTSINGVKLEGGAVVALQAQDRIRIGSTELKFLPRGDPEVYYTGALELRAQRDALTGIYNKGFILEALDAQFERARANGESLSLLIVDLDRFKQVNDTLGHDVGDHVLVSFATLLTDTIQRVGAVVGRFGGEEFIALLPNCGTLTGKILWSTEEPLLDQQPDEVCRQIAGLVARAHELLLSWGLQLTGLGVGLPGAFDETTGKVHFAANLGWWNVDFMPQFTLALAQVRLPPMPVYVQNEADTAALSEYEFVEGQISDSLIFVTCDVGVGAGIVLNDRLFTGQYGGAGEIGHSILQIDGPLCSCGRHGCAETFFGARVLDKLVTPDMGGKYLGVVLANLWTTFDPSVLIVGGPSCIKHPGLIVRARESLQAYASSARMPAPPVRPAHYGLLASAVGAAALVLHRQLRPMHTPTAYAANGLSVVPLTQSSTSFSGE